MERPWLKLFTRDWLDDLELTRCSFMARAVLFDLMCVASEGVPHGYLASGSGPLAASYLSGRCRATPAQFRKAVQELLGYGRLHQDERGYFIKRMVRDEEIRLARAAGGSASINHPKVPKKDTLPSGFGGDPPLSRERASRALTSDADSGSMVLDSDPERISQIQQVRDWLNEYMGEQWPMPDVAVATEIYEALNGADVKELGDFLRKLHRQGQKPERSWAWFPPVIRRHFEGRKHGGN